MAVTDVYDSTWANAAHLPAGLHAGYRTGSGGVPWPLDAEADNPGMIWYDQSPVNTAADELADLIDCENGAATLADLAPWRKAARAAYLAGARPGQRDPGIYFSRSDLHKVVNALIAGGVLFCPLVIADYSGTRAQAAAEVDTSGGPFPVVGRQYADAGLYDLSVFSNAWLSAVSGKPGASPAGRNNVVVTKPPPGTWKAGGPVVLTGPGPDGRDLWQTVSYDGITWSPPVKL
jgi:hypothetical protein